MQAGDPPAPGVAGAVLAGGYSRRMGRDKALLILPDDPRPLLVRALDALRAAGCGPLWVSVRELPSPYDALLAEHVVRAVADLRPGEGPLAALEALLAAFAEPATSPDWLLVVACDMPRLDPSLLRALCAARAPEVDAVVPRVDGRAQPLHALYHRRALTSVRAALDAGRLAATRLLDDLTVRWLDLPDATSFTNLNTPQQAGLDG